MFLLFHKVCSLSGVIQIWMNTFKTIFCLHEKCDKAAVIHCAFTAGPVISFLKLWFYTFILFYIQGKVIFKTNNLQN